VAAVFFYFPPPAPSVHPQGRTTLSARISALSAAHSVGGSVPDAPRHSVIFPYKKQPFGCFLYVILSKILFDKMSKHFQNFHKSSENAVIENERHP
jgi:hypothetical protein